MALLVWPVWMVEIGSNLLERYLLGLEFDFVICHSFVQ